MSGGAHTVGHKHSSLSTAEAMGMGGHGQKNLHSVASLRANAGMGLHLAAESRALSGQVPASSALSEIADAQQEALDELWNW